MVSPAAVRPTARRIVRGVGLPAAMVLMWSACSDGSGIEVPALEIRTTTTGTGLDPDGYTVMVDDGEARPIGVTDTLFIDPLAAGPHTVTLAGVASNCGVAGENPVTTTVAAGDQATVSFTVTCGTAAGAIQVSVATTGSPADPDGYAVTLDGEPPGLPVATTGSVSFSGVPAGSHTVALGGVASNCLVQGENPRPVEVSTAGPAAISFSVSCTPSLIAFTANAVDLLAIFVVNPDGSEPRNLTPAGTFERNPVWSPDGARMLFARADDFSFTEGLYVMDADGGGRVKLADGDRFDAYRWSPDGSMVAFVALRFEVDEVFSDLWVMRADGSGKVRVAGNAEGLSWSPDGRRIAYASNLGGLHIRIVNSDGSGDRRLTARTLSAFQPAWSPDGDRIAFVALNPNEIMLVNPDGSGLENLTHGLGEEDSPAWSPDGGRLVFNSVPRDQPLESEVAVMNRDGSGRANLTNRPGFDLSPDWSPDGRRIVFVRGDETNDEIYVMNADGSEPVNVSNRPDTFDSAPDWGGQTQQVVAGRLSRAYSAWLRMQGVRGQRWRLPGRE